MTTINWKIGREDAEVITKIAERAEKEDLRTGPRVRLVMDLTAAHLNAYPLDLAGLLAADRFSFSHDVLGIVSHINRDTGKLADFFVPRFARSCE